MNTTPFTNAEGIAALRRAKRRLPEELFICTALPSTPVGDLLRKKIRKGLEGWPTLEQWAWDRGYDMTLNQGFLARQAWLDKLISILEKKIEEGNP